MKIIISPAKKMNRNTDTLAVKGIPVYQEETEKLKSYLQGLTYEELKELWKCNEKLARMNYERLRQMNLEQELTPALLSYEGLQYQYMAPAVLEDGQWEYVQEHVCILSGFYGVVRPLDGVVPYRLEMQAKVRLPGVNNLYEYWGEKLYNIVAKDTKVILNLASKEYSKCIERYLHGDIEYITCVFGEYRQGKIIEKGSYAKMARGEMVRYMAEHHIEDVQQIKGFQRLGYRFAAEHSDEARYVFVKQQH